jgi:hypothetical protein
LDEIKPDKPPVDSDDRIRRFECFNIVQRIRREVTAGKTEADITVQFPDTIHCNTLQDSRKNVCLTLIPWKIPTIVSQLTKRQHPDQICQSLGFSRNFDIARSISKDRCVEYVGLFKKTHTKSAVSTGNTTTASPKRDLMSRLRNLGRSGKLSFLPSFVSGLTVCKDVASDQKMLCHIISRMVSGSMKEELDQGLSAEDICTKMVDKKLIKFSGADKPP